MRGAVVEVELTPAAEFVDFVWLGFKFSASLIVTELTSHTRTLNRSVLSMNGGLMVSW